MVHAAMNMKVAKNPGRNGPNWRLMASENTETLFLVIYIYIIGHKRPTLHLHSWLDLTTIERWQFVDIIWWICWWTQY